MNPKLQEAVAIFKELGWEKVTPENIMELSLGTLEQKKKALAGLKSGNWGESGGAENNYGWIRYVDVDEGKLALFAIRMGIDARRAANVLQTWEKEEMIVAVISERGAKYAKDFIQHACVSSRRWLEHSASTFGNVAVRLVDKLNLEIPQSVDYMKDWSVYAAIAMEVKAEMPRSQKNLPDLEMIKRRFKEHILTGVAVNTPATGPFGRVLPAGVEQDWLSREQALPLVFSALDSAIRPGDRKVWLEVLDELEVTDEEIQERIEAMIPLLASGDAALVKRLAPVLIEKAEGDLLTEVLLASLSTTTKKVKQLVLKAALHRSAPANAKALSPWFSQLTNDKDKTIASLGEKLANQWAVNIQVEPVGETTLQGLWQETPPLWEVPPFELGNVSSEELTELAAKLVRQPAVIHDILGEQFLAMANALAYENPQVARISLQGLRGNHQPILHYVMHWVKGGNSYGADKDSNFGVRDLLTARDFVVSLCLEKIPCLLSTPSFVDMTIDFSDLVSRIEHYMASGLDVLEADLFLALTRLHPDTATPKAKEKLSQLDVPILLQSGERMPATANHVILAYLKDSIQEPALIIDEYKKWRIGEIKMPESLNGFPCRFDFYYTDNLYSIFPLWGDAALQREMCWRDWVHHEKGLLLRQIARRRIPLSPGGTMNFLAIQRSSPSHNSYNVEDSTLAVIEAWERGLLRPGVADVALLDWSTNPPSHLGALVSALEMIAGDGLLSVVWPILDNLVTESLKASRLISGTAEVVEAILTLLPEVQFAIDRGVASKNALDLSGVRELATRSGSSRAVMTAKEIVEKI